jgi:ferredoxin
MNEKISEVTIAYFSGTGCTKLAADGFETRLSELGFNTKMRDIAKNASWFFKNGLQADLLMVLSDLLAGRLNLLHPKPQDRLLAGVGKMEHAGAKLFGEHIRASNDCVRCGLCVKNCPQKNIRLQSGKMRFGYHCMLCMRCFYGCPERALSPGVMKNFVLKDGFNLEKLRDTAEQSAGGEYRDVPKKFLWKGVYKYLNDK